jgi:hypothetical protein
MSSNKDHTISNNSNTKLDPSNSGGSSDNMLENIISRESKDIQRKVVDTMSDDECGSRDQIGDCGSDMTFKREI